MISLVCLMIVRWAMVEDQKLFGRKRYIILRALGRNGLRIPYITDLHRIIQDKLISIQLNTRNIDVLTG